MTRPSRRIPCERTCICLIWTLDVEDLRSSTNTQTDLQEDEVQYPDRVKLLLQESESFHGLLCLTQGHTVLPLTYVFLMHLSGCCCHESPSAACSLLYPRDTALHALRFLIHTYLMLHCVVRIAWRALDRVRMLLPFNNTSVGPALPRLSMARMHLFNTFRVSESNSTPYLRPPRAVFKGTLFLDSRHPCRVVPSIKLPGKQ